MESGLRPAATQLENRQRRFRLCLLSLPQRDQGRELARVSTPIGCRLIENPIILEEPATLDIELI